MRRGRLSRITGDNPPLAAERGASLIEFTIVVPVFLLLLFAILEFGLGFNSLLSAYNTSRSSARVASAMGNEPEADYATVRAAVKAGNAAVTGELQRIVVFEASGPDAAVPAECKTATVGVAGRCNVYLPADFADAEAAYGCNPGELDAFWCPAVRKVALTGSGGPPDYVGVYIEIKHGMLTGLFGGERVIADQTVMRIEPRRR